MLRSRVGFRGSAALGAFVLAWCAAALHPAAAADVAVAEAGSTLMQPLLQSWAAAYAKVDPQVGITVSGGGSGKGISAAVDGSVQFGASDAYMSDVDLLHHPGMLNIPLAISAQMVNYNLPGLSAALKLSGPVLAGIYDGSIRNWNDKQIVALNEGIALPNHAIVPIRRSDASGDTFLFTQFLTFSTPSWEQGPGFGTDVAWPEVPGSQTAAGNEGMVQTLQKTPFSVAYIGISLTAAVASAGLGTARLMNESGHFVLPTPETVTEAADALTPRTPADERLTLAFAPGDNSYPLINYEYAIVRRQQPNAAQAAALSGFLIWAITPGKGSIPAYLDPVHFIALPPSISALSESQIAKLR